MRRSTLGCFRAVLAAGCQAAVEAQGEAERFLDGNPQDKDGLAGSVLSLGGGRDMAEGIQSMITRQGVRELRRHTERGAAGLERWPGLQPSVAGNDQRQPGGSMIILGLD